MCLAAYQMCSRPSGDKLLICTASRSHSISKSYIWARMGCMYRGVDCGASYLHMPIALIWCWGPHNPGVVATMLL